MTLLRIFCAPFVRFFYPRNAGAAALKAEHRQIAIGGMLGLRGWLFLRMLL